MLLRVISLKMVTYLHILVLVTMAKLMLFWKHYNCPVVPVNMTRSNLIVHHIIGEPFANQIDSAIQLLNDKLLASLGKDESLRSKLCDYSSSLGNDPTERFPCLTESSNIRLLFKSQNSRVRLH